MYIFMLIIIPPLRTNWMRLQWSAYFWAMQFKRDYKGVSYKSSFFTDLMVSTLDLKNKNHSFLNASHPIANIPPAKWKSECLPNQRWQFECMVWICVKWTPAYQKFRFMKRCYSFWDSIMCFWWFVQVTAMIKVKLEPVHVHTGRHIFSMLYYLSESHRYGTYLTLQ